MNDIGGRSGILASQLIQVFMECFSQCHYVVDALTDGKATKGQWVERLASQRAEFHSLTW